MGLKNDIFWSEIDSEFGEPGNAHHQEFSGVPPGDLYDCSY